MNLLEHIMKKQVGSLTGRLAGLKAGSQARLVTIHGDHGIQSKMAAMGLLPGTALEVVRASKTGPVLISVRGSRIMLGHGLAGHIEVVSE
jgi:Fe2+ transport system protein FeoA